MKTFEVTIKKNRTATECGFEWPSWWGDVVQKVNVVAYEDSETLGKSDEGCVCVTDDATWKEIAKKKDPSITALTVAAANTKGRAWRPQVTRITDEKKVLLITAKAALGTKLSDDEKKALDPDDAETGIGKSKLFDVGKIALNAEDSIEASI